METKTIELGIDKKVTAVISNVERTTIDDNAAVTFTIEIDGNKAECYDWLNGDRIERRDSATQTQNNGLISFLIENIDYTSEKHEQSYEVLEAVEETLQSYGAGGHFITLDMFDNAIGEYKSPWCESGKTKSGENTNVCRKCIYFDLDNKRDAIWEDLVE